MWTASTSTQWLQSVFEAIGNSPPKGFSWTSHSLRKGAASAANATKVPLNDIRYSGGWSTNSTVLEAKYIDLAMAPSKAAYIFFGNLKRDKPLDALSEETPRAPRDEPAHQPKSGAPQPRKRGNATDSPTATRRKLH